MHRRREQKPGTQGGCKANKCDFDPKVGEATKKFLQKCLICAVILVGVLRVEGVT